MKQVVGELRYVGNEVHADFDEEIEAPNQWVMDHGHSRVWMTITLSVRRVCLFHIEGILTAGNAWVLNEIIHQSRRNCMVE